MIYLKNNTESQKLYIPRTGIYGGPVTPPLYQEGYDDGVEHQRSLLTSTTITEDGEYVREDGFSAVTVDIDEQKYYDSGYTEGQEAQKSLLSSTAITENGVYTSENGWSAVTVNTQTGITPVYGSLTATTNGEYTPSDVDAFSAVTVDVDEAPAYNSGYTEGYESGYTSGSTDGYNTGYPEGYASGYTSGSTDGFSSGYTEGQNAQKSLLSDFTALTNGVYTSETGYSGFTVDLPLGNTTITIGSNGVTVLNTPEGFAGMKKVTIQTEVDVVGPYNSGFTEGYASGYTEGLNSGQSKFIGEVAVECVYDGGGSSSYWAGMREAIPVSGWYLELINDQTYDVNGARVSVRVSEPTNIKYFTTNTGQTQGFLNSTNLVYARVYDNISVLADDMFRRCRDLTGVTLSNTITIIPENCFSGSGLKSINIPSGVTRLKTDSLSSCHSLSSITFNSLTAPNVSEYPFNYINPVGTVTVPEGAKASYNTLMSQLPVWWEIHEPNEHDYSQDYLTLRFSGNGYFGWNNSGMTTTCPIQYSINGGGWTTIGETTTSEEVRVSDGDVVRFKGTNIDGYNYNHTKYWCFSTSTDFEVEGNIFSLIYGDDFASYSEFPSGVTGYTFDSLFKGCIHLTSSENIVLPGNILIESCYRALFSNCRAMTKTLNALNAEYLGNKCYGYMYENCYALEKAPALMSVNGLRYDGQVAESAYIAFLISCSTVSNVITYHNGDTTASFLSNLFGGNATSNSNWVNGIPTDAKIYVRNTDIPVRLGHTVTLFNQSYQ